MKKIFFFEGIAMGQNTKSFSQLAKKKGTIFVPIY